MTKKSESRNSLKTLKFRNRNLVLSFMRTSGAISVNEISRATGLSKMTVHKIIDYYLEEGMISNAGKGVSTEEGGKKPNLFSFNAQCRFIFTIRIAGDFLSTAIVNLKGEMIVGRKSTPINNTPFGDIAAMIGAAFAEQLAQAALSPDRCLAAVVGANGIIDSEKGECLASYQFPRWGKNIGIRDALRAHLPENIPVHVDSWWRHLAHSEIYYAAGDERARFFLIGNSGDYISGGLVAESRVCQGASGFAGETGHLIVAPGAGEKCVCGGMGCLEAVAAPGAILKRAEAERVRHPDSQVFAADLAGGLADIGKAADAGDELARKLLDETAGHFAVALGNIIQTCDPGLTLFFGDYARCGEYFFAAMRQRLSGMNLLGVDKRTRIEPSKFTEEHGIVGAAIYMTDTLFAARR